MTPLQEILKLGSHGVSGLWQYILPPDLNLLRVPEEKDTTCQNCPQIPSDNYRPDYRCCTYFPRITNFSLGLAHKYNPTSAKVINKLKKQGFLLPEGLIPTPKMWADYVCESEQDRFGKTNLVTCPFLQKDTGFCGIYEFRNAVCSTFFCRHDHGESGDRFWQALEAVVSQSELALSQWALKEAGFPLEKYFKKLDRIRLASLKHPKKAWPSEIREQLWGKWFGRELELYQATADIIEENKEKLWDIANKTEIIEASKFEQRASASIPEEFREEEDDDDDDSETVPPKKLWQKLKRAQQNLWKIPGGPLQISPKLTINKQKFADAEDKYFQKRAYIARMHTTAKHKTVESHHYLDLQTVNCLQLFETPQHLSPEVMQKISEAGDPLTLIPEWLGKKFLIPA